MVNLAIPENLVDYSDQDIAFKLDVRAGIENVESPGTVGDVLVLTHSDTGLELGLLSKCLVLIGQQDPYVPLIGRKCQFLDPGTRGNQTTQTITQNRPGYRFCS